MPLTTAWWRPAIRPLGTSLPPGAGPAGCQAQLSTAAVTAQAGDLDFLLQDDLVYLPQSNEESEVLLISIAERCERRSLGIAPNLVFSGCERIFAHPMVTAAAIDRVVHLSVILEFDVPSYRTEAAQQRRQTAAAEEVDRQHQSTTHRQIWLTRDKPGVPMLTVRGQHPPDVPFGRRRLSRHLGCP